jgi:hypothetical protein
MRKAIFILTAICILLSLSCSSKISDNKNKLTEWRKGVWLSPDGTFTIYTDTHYFVVMASGDTSSANIYCGASQIQFHNKGMARKQVLRIRQLPGGKMFLFNGVEIQSNNIESPMKIDTTQFALNTCNIKEGIIYDSITETTKDYILLSTCNGDREKIFSNGISVYLPKDGGEFYSYRIERF